MNNTLQTVKLYDNNPLWEIILYSPFLNMYYFHIISQSVLFYSLLITRLLHGLNSDWSVISVQQAVAADRFIIGSNKISESVFYSTF